MNKSKKVYMVVDAAPSKTYGVFDNKADAEKLTQTLTQHYVFTEDRAVAYFIVYNTGLKEVSTYSFT